MHVHTALKLTDVLRLQSEQFVGHQIPFVYVINVWYSERGRRSKGGIFLSPLGETLYRYQYSAELPQVLVVYITAPDMVVAGVSYSQGRSSVFRIAFFFHVYTCMWVIIQTLYVYTCISISHVYNVHDCVYNVHVHDCVYNVHDCIYNVYT